jgi:hypothetical protein
VIAADPAVVTFPANTAGTFCPDDGYAVTHVVTLPPLIESGEAPAALSGDATTMSVDPTVGVAPPVDLGVTVTVDVPVALTLLSEPPRNAGATADGIVPEVTRTPLPS